MREARNRNGTHTRDENMDTRQAHSVTAWCTSSKREVGGGKERAEYDSCVTEGRAHTDEDAYIINMADKTWTRRKHAVDSERITC